MTKFVGKFRKNKEYNDDYDYTHSKHRNEHAEIKKILSEHEKELLEDDLNWEDSEVSISQDEKY